MLKYIYLLLIVINVLCVISGKKYKSVSVFSIVFIISFLVGVEYNESVVGYDLRNYEIMYNDTSLISSLEIGYKLVNIACNLVGLSFYQFHMILIIICFLLIFKHLYRINTNVHLIIVAYLLYFILPPTGQLRNLCALTVFIRIFPIVQDDTKEQIKKEFLIITCASLFHISFVMFYLIMLIHIKRKNKNKYYKILFGIVVFITVASILLKRNKLFVELFKLVLKFGGDTGQIYVERYATTTTSMSPLASIVILLLLVYAINIWGKKSLNERYINCFYDSTKLKIASESIKNIVFISACFLPLLILNATMYRFIRDISFVGIIHLGINCDGKIKIKNRVRLLIMTILICMGWFIYDVIIKGYWTDFAISFFENSIWR